jgi:hypothetical protein
VGKLPWNSDGVDGAMESVNGEAEGEESKECEETPPPKRRKSIKSPEDRNEFGFSKELMLPYRLKMNGEKETGLPIVLPKGANDSDEIVGEWACGFRHPIAGFTVADYKGQESKRTLQDGSLFEIEHMRSRHRINITQKVDRFLLVIIQEQTKQVCMVRADKFGPVADQTCRLPQDDDTLQACLKLMTDLATRFAKGEVERSDLLATRNQMLLEAGVSKASGTKVSGASSSKEAEKHQVKQKKTKKQKETNKKVKQEKGIEKPATKKEKVKEEKPEEIKDVGGEATQNAMVRKKPAASTSHSAPVASLPAAAEEENNPGFEMPSPPELDTLGAYEMFMSTSS